MPSASASRAARASDDSGTSGERLGIGLIGPFGAVGFAFQDADTQKQGTRAATSVSRAQLDALNLQQPLDLVSRS